MFVQHTFILSVFFFDMDIPIVVTQKIEKFYPDLDFPYLQTQTLDFSRVFTCKSYFQFLISSPNRERFLLDKFIWKSKAPSKVRTFVLNSINTNNVVQKRRPLTALSPNMCIMCGLDFESGAHLFVHCPMARSTKNKLFGIFRESGVCPMDLHHFLLTKLRGFGSCKDAKILQQSLVYVLLWYIWLDKHARIFNDSLLTINLIWHPFGVLLKVSL